MSTNITTDVIKKLREKVGAGMMDCKKALTECEGDFEKAVDWLRKKGLAAAAKKSSRVAAEGLIGVAPSDQYAAMIEVNSETDFVAKNQKFQDFVKAVANVAGAQKISDLNALMSASLDSGTVEDSLKNLIAVIGENMTLRRVTEISVGHGVVATYIHSAIAPGLGKIGVLVALESDGSADKLREFGKKLAMHIAASNPQYLSIEEVPASVLEHEKGILQDQIKDSGRPPEVINKMIEGRIRKFYGEVVLLEQPFVMDPKKTVSQVIDEFAKELGTAVTLKGYIKYVLGEGIEKVTADFTEEVQALSH